MSTLQQIYDVILQGKRNEVEALVKQALDEGQTATAIIEQALRPAMDEVGERFSRAEFFLPDLILAAEATKRATAFLRPLLADGSAASRQETIVIGTVQGDLHDIGKNLVVATLEGTGYRVVDLGVDVAPEKFVEAVRQHNPAVVGFSALLSTTMVNIPRTIDALREAGLRDGRLLAVGGAPVTQRNADEWQVEIYAADAGHVLEAGWSNVGYGQYVILDHGNGYRTLYAHMSVIIARRGQAVEKGTKIGLIGSTGRSTGPHLHFEVYKNGVLQNPFHYLP